MFFRIVVAIEIPHAHRIFLNGQYFATGLEVFLQQELFNCIGTFYFGHFVSFFYWYISLRD